jgi:hypothetical protein
MFVVLDTYVVGRPNDWILSPEGALLLRWVLSLTGEVEERAVRSEVSWGFAIMKKLISVACSLVGVNFQWF